MKILEKIHWKTQLQWRDITYFFSKNKRDQLKRLEKQLNDFHITRGTLELDWILLEEFYSLYTKEISKKENHIIQNLIEKYTDELWKGILYFSYIRNNSGTLYAWCITSFRNGCYTLAFKASQENEELDFQPIIWIWNMLDFMVFEFWIKQLHAKYISFWKDRNFSWTLWPKTTLAMMKLSKKLTPHTFEWNKIIEVNIHQIATESIIFDNIWEDWMFQSAKLFIPKEKKETDIMKIYSPLLKHETIKTEILFF